MYLAFEYMGAGQVDRGLSIAGAGFEEGLSLGLPMQAALCADAMLTALLWRGRLGEAEQRLEEIGELGVPASRQLCPDAELLLARGDAHAAAPLVREAAADTQTASRMPEDNDVLTELELAVMIDDRHAAVETARSYLSQMDEFDSPLVAAGAARIGFQALCLDRSAPGERIDELRGPSSSSVGGGRRRAHRRVAPDVPRGPARSRRGLRRQVRRRTGRR